MKNIRGDLFVAGLLVAVCLLAYCFSEYSTRRAHRERVRDMIDVSRPPYNADRSGMRDSTSAILRAADDARKTGKSGIYIPAGNYIMSGQPIPP